MLKVVVYRMLEKSNENLKFSGKYEAGKILNLKSVVNMRLEKF